MNENNLDLGQKQKSDKPIGNVILPPWASNAHEFIRIHREALESEYVSLHLHQWIDLIFGCKQKGEEALKNDNLFFHLTYEGSVDINQIHDQVERQSVVAQVLSFGQCPSQLFLEAHPTRSPLSSTISSLRMNPEAKLFRDIPAHLPFGLAAMIDIKFIPSQIFFKGNNLIVMSSKGQYSRLKVTSQLHFHESESSSSSSNFSLLSFSSGTQQNPTSVGSSGLGKSMTASESSESIGSSANVQTTLSNNGILSFYLFNSQILQDNLHSWTHRTRSHHEGLEQQRFFVDVKSKYLISCGHWDSSIQVSSLDPKWELKQSLDVHLAITTCLKLLPDHDVLVTGSVDGTVLVWNIRRRTLLKSNLLSIVEEPQAVLRGHHYGVTCLDVDHNMDVVVSGARDGRIIFHSLSKSAFVRCVWVQTILAIESCSERDINSEKFSITSIHVAQDGRILVYCAAISTLMLFDIDARLIFKKTLRSPITSSILVSSGGKYFVTGGRQKLKVRLIHNFTTVNSVTMESAVTCLAFSDKEDKIFVGLNGAKIKLLGPIV